MWGSESWEVLEELQASCTVLNSPVFPFVAPEILNYEPISTATDMW